VQPTVAQRGHKAVVVTVAVGQSRAACQHDARMEDVWPR
jgi:hypothetical protein